MPKVASESLAAIAEKATALLRRHRVQLTLGGEPSYVPVEPEGAEWSITALGPTKQRYAYALADELIQSSIPGAVVFFSPGKTYPGEVNPRWAIHLVWNRDGQPLAPTGGEITSASEIRRKLLRTLKVPDHWMRARDVAKPRHEIWVLPLDHNGKKWRSEKWPLGKKIDLLGSEGPAGLRLPLQLLPEKVAKRALTLEWKEGELRVFFPPLLQGAFASLLQLFNGCANIRFEGYVPGDDANTWSKLSLTPDPGVLEVNLPPCADAVEYFRWMQVLETCATTVGLRSFKQRNADETFGTGGGNHLLFGGPSLDANGFFKHPRWITSILRYWQRHPSLSYMFTGDYVGSSSQAPRPDESARELYDLEMAYRFLEALPAGKDNRYLISETLRHLHTDGSGNTHRSEISFDKFWNVSWEGGCRGLIEFRAVETMPNAAQMSAVAALWQALDAMLFEKTFTRPLIDHGDRVHDYFFLPSPLWSDFAEVLRDLREAGFTFDAEVFREIWRWRFPGMLAFENDGARLVIRKALESWPLLCETPLEGGSTSRFVDTSMERIEFLANKKFAACLRIFAQGCELPLTEFTRTSFGAGLRYRRTALHPSLHPGIAPHMPLHLLLKRGTKEWHYKLEADRRVFQPTHNRPPEERGKCKKLKPALLTSDLRIE
ncbi:MAG: hypothetical protein QOD99_2368 [Chthoniobacter sp.]|jgi:uncharacterized protein (DUF2126 family)|nr:hypothetical protein [Chthoniobacter sp.]